MLFSKETQRALFPLRYNRTLCIPCSGGTPETPNNIYRICDMEKRQKIIKIRLTEDEYDELLKRKTEKSLAPWIRATCLKQAIEDSQIIKADPDLVRQIAIIGNNLNQIARHVNRNREVDFAVSQSLKKIEQSLEGLLENATQNI